MRDIGSEKPVRLRSAPHDRSRTVRSLEDRCARKAASALPVAATRGAKAYRIVVRSKQFGCRSYRWEIVEDNTDTIIRQSSAWYNSMEQAYQCGTAELAVFCDGRAGSRGVKVT
jgi:hypothetical protein